MIVFFLLPDQTNLRLLHSPPQATLLFLICPLLPLPPPKSSQPTGFLPLILSHPSLALHQKPTEVRTLKRVLWVWFFSPHPNILKGPPYFFSSPLSHAIYPSIPRAYSTPIQGRIFRGPPPAKKNSAISFPLGGLGGKEILLKRVFGNNRNPPIVKILGPGLWR